MGMILKLQEQNSFISLSSRTHNKGQTNIAGLYVAATLQIIVCRCSPSQAELSCRCCFAK